MNVNNKKNFLGILFVTFGFFMLSCSQVIYADDLDVLGLEGTLLGDNARTEIYSRKQSDVEYKFYDINGKLGAGIVNPRGFQKLSISEDDIPQDLQTNLDAEKIAKLRFMLEQCYFRKMGDKVFIHARGLGGWGDWQHKGYYIRGKLTYCYPSEGTYIWARDILEFNQGGRDAQYLGKMSGLDKAIARAKNINAIARARNIGDACAAVDTDYRDPLKHLGQNAQQWHFNVNDCPGGAQNDSRIQLAVQELVAAAELGDEKHLGYGLHALGDVFAHTDAFVGKYTIDNGHGGKTEFYGHVVIAGQVAGSTTIDYRASKQADNPYFQDANHCSFLSLLPEDAAKNLSQRYSDTKTASYLLLYVYRLLIGQPNNGDIEQLITDRVVSSLNAGATGEAAGAAAVVPAPAAIELRGTHGVLGFINALLANDCIKSNAPALTFLTTLKGLFTKGHNFYDAPGSIVGLSGKFTIPYRSAPQDITGVTELFIRLATAQQEASDGDYD